MDFTLSELSPMNIMTLICNVDDSAKGGYDMILGQDLLIELGLNLKFSDCVIEADDGPFKGYKASMVAFGTYVFKKI